MAADDWYQRRRQDAEGEFFRRVAGQGPRSGPGTRQGVYCLTASGTLLGWRNPNQPQYLLDLLHDALRRWENLPAAERSPGALAVPPLDDDELDERFVRRLPEGGLVVNVYTRVLEQDDAGRLHECSGEETGYEGLATAVDRMWLTRDEWRSLTRDALQTGQRFELPEAIATRLVQFHLVDNTRGEPTFWRSDEVRERQLQLEVARADDERLELRLSGRVLLSTDADLEHAQRGYDATLSGTLVYDRQRDEMSLLEIAVLGEHWGQGRHTPGARPGRNPLTVFLELAPMTSPVDQIPPQGMRDPWSYLP